LERHALKQADKMEEDPTKPDAKAVLEYGNAAGPMKVDCVWPALLGAIQFMWIPFISLGMLGWDGPKRLVPDSLFMLLMATPTIAAVLTSILSWRYYAPRGKRSIAAFICICVFVVSALVLCGLVHMWVTDMLLDRNGKWSPV
jgi:hypothetical protein